MSQLVIDASVAIKWFVREVHSEHALTILNGHHTLFAPDLLFTECGSILWKKVRRREFGQSDAWRIFRTLEQVPIDASPDATLRPLALEIAFQSGRSVYDSMYIACAMEWEVPMVTADERLYNATRNGPLMRHIVWVAEPLDGRE